MAAVATGPGAIQVSTASRGWVERRAAAAISGRRRLSFSRTRNMRTPIHKATRANGVDWERVAQGWLIITGVRWTMDDGRCGNMCMRLTGWPRRAGRTGLVDMNLGAKIVEQMAQCADG